MYGYGEICAELVSYPVRTKLWASYITANNFFGKLWKAHFVRTNGYCNNAIYIIVYYLVRTKGEAAISAPLGRPLGKRTSAQMVCESSEFPGRNPCLAFERGIH